jgi:hypothetical protein
VTPTDINISLTELKFTFNVLHSSKTAATTISFGQTVYQRGCLAQCTETGRIVNGQINGLFCCNSTLCNTVTSGS